MNVNRGLLPILSLSIVLLALLPALAGSPSAPPASSMEGADTIVVFDRVIPLGVDACIFKSSNRPLYLLASATSDDFRGMRQITRGKNRWLFARDGQSMKFYPERVSFRVTLSSRANTLLDVDPIPVEVAGDPNGYMVNLRFRLKLFQGLHITEIAPDEVKMIGMPADVPYDERIYRVTFYLDHVPLLHRSMLEILSPEGKRIAKFHLDLM